MIINLVHKHFSQSKVDSIKAEIATMGTPVIKAVDLGDDEYQALEGCHRIRACKDLGITPELEIIDYSEKSVFDYELDFQDDRSIAEIVDSCYGQASIEF